MPAPPARSPRPTACMYMTDSLAPMRYCDTLKCLKQEDATKGVQWRTGGLNSSGIVTFRLPDDFYAEAIRTTRSSVGQDSTILDSDMNKHTRSWFLAIRRSKSDLSDATVRAYRTSRTPCNQHIEKPVHCSQACSAFLNQPSAIVSTSPAIQKGWTLSLLAIDTLCTAT